MAAQTSIIDLPTDEMAAQTSIIDLPTEDMAAQTSIIDLPTDDMAAQTSVIDLPESVLLKVLAFLPVKDRCLSGQVCRQWRRIVQDNSLWRHVDLLGYKLDLSKMWKVLRAHLSPCLVTMKISGYAHTVGRKRKRASISNAILKELDSRCPNLSHLLLYDCNTDELSAEFLPRSLCALSIIHSTWQPRWLKGRVVSRYLEIFELDLTNSVRVDNFDLEDIAELADVHTLTLSGCYRVSGPAIRCVAEKLCLEYLDISGTRVDEEGLHHLARYAGGLKSLNIARLDSVNDSSLETLAKGPKWLKEIDISGCKAVTLNGIKGLWHFKKLEKVIMCDVLCDGSYTEDDILSLRTGFQNKVEIVLC